MSTPHARQVQELETLDQLMDGDCMVFLRQLGLEEYIELFRQHDIRMSNLPDITDDQLQEMGVSVGHRMQLQAKLDEYRKAKRMVHRETVIWAEPDKYNRYVFPCCCVSRGFPCCCFRPYRFYKLTHSRLEVRSEQLGCCWGCCCSKAETDPVQLEYVTDVEWAHQGRCWWHFGIVAATVQGAGTQGSLHKRDQYISGARCYEFYVARGTEDQVGRKIQAAVEECQQSAHGSAASKNRTGMVRGDIGMDVAQVGVLKS